MDIQFDVKYGVWDSISSPANTNRESLMFLSESDKKYIIHQLEQIHTECNFSSPIVEFYDSNIPEIFINDLISTSNITVSDYIKTVMTHVCSQILCREQAVENINDTDYDFIIQTRTDMITARTKGDWIIKVIDETSNEKYKNSIYLRNIMFDSFGIYTSDDVSMSPLEPYKLYHNRLRRNITSALVEICKKYDDDNILGEIIEPHRLSWTVDSNKDIVNYNEQNIKIKYNELMTRAAVIVRQKHMSYNLFSKCIYDLCALSEEEYTRIIHECATQIEK